MGPYECAICNGEHNKNKVAKGYTLYVPQIYHHALLIDMAGDV